MFSFLVALTLYMSLVPAQPTVSVADFLPRSRAFLPLAAVAEKPVSIQAPVKKDSMRLGVETSSRAAIVTDWRTGETLYAKDPDTSHPIASITKLMTALVVLREGVDMEDVLDIGPQDMRQGGMAYVIPGERIKVRDLFNVSLVASGNDAAAALARSTGLTAEEFAARMNSVAIEIGMRNANFVEPTGLDARNVASARDVSLLVRAALDTEPLRETVLQNEYRFVAETGLEHRVRSTNQLLDSHLSRPPYAFLGGKTGYLDEAGYCFAAAARNPDGDRVIAVALGAPDKDARFREVKDLIYWAFDAYAWPYAPLE